ncbi:unnamed protein product [Nesidiocoris tenuis]|uniref:Uncharacterized protein n=1 Tax=Nesidiocoris tenuis TaxID=355587 RepID=A0A6H5H233_9HEMI|nr:unnamed protein product [Nesidiocoris tenuis]
MSRYVGDFTAAELESPENAAKFASLAKETLRQKTNTVKALRKKNDRLKKRVATLKMMVRNLQKHPEVLEYKRLTPLEKRVKMKQMMAEGDAEYWGRQPDTSVAADGHKPFHPGEKCQTGPMIGHNLTCAPESVNNDHHRGQYSYEANQQFARQPYGYDGASWHNDGEPGDTKPPRAKRRRKDADVGADGARNPLRKRKFAPRKRTGPRIVWGEDVKNSIRQEFFCYVENNQCPPTEFVLQKMPRLVYKHPELMTQCPNQLKTMEHILRATKAATALRNASPMPKTSHLHQEALHLYRETLRLYQEMLHIYREPLHLSRETLLMFQEPLQLYHETLHLYQEALHLHQETLHLYQEALHLYRETLLMYQEMLHIYREPLHLSRETLHLYQETLHMFQEPLQLYHETLHLHQEMLYLFQEPTHLQCFIGISKGSIDFKKRLICMNKHIVYINIIFVKKRSICIKKHFIRFRWRPINFMQHIIHIKIFIYIQMRLICVQSISSKSRNASLSPRNVPSTPTNASCTSRSASVTSSASFTSRFASTAPRSVPTESSAQLAPRTVSPRCDHQDV